VLELGILTLCSFCRNDPTPGRGAQLPRASALIVSSLGFIHDLRQGILEPDMVRGTPLDMDQYQRLFGTARIPTQVNLGMRS
jgi:carnitine O-acetyltransferase